MPSLYETIRDIDMDDINAIFQTIKFEYDTQIVEDGKKMETMPFNLNHVGLNSSILNYMIESIIKDTIKNNISEAIKLPLYTEKYCMPFIHTDSGGLRVQSRMQTDSFSHIINTINLNETKEAKTNTTRKHPCECLASFGGCSLKFYALEEPLKKKISSCPLKLGCPLVSVGGTSLF
jgi:hypothetical protein